MHRPQTVAAQPQGFMCNATKMVPLRVQAEEPGHERQVAGRLTACPG